MTWTLVGGFMWTDSNVQARQMFSCVVSSVDANGVESVSCIEVSVTILVS